MKGKVKKKKGEEIKLKSNYLKNQRQFFSIFVHLREQGMLFRKPKDAIPIAYLTKHTKNYGTIVFKLKKRSHNIEDWHLV